MMSMTLEEPRPPPPPNPPPPPPPSSATLIWWMTFRSTRSCAMTSSGTSRRSTTMRIVFLDILVVIEHIRKHAGKVVAFVGQLGKLRAGWQPARRPPDHARRAGLDDSPELVELELGVGSAQLDIVNVLGVAFPGGLNRCHAVLLIGVLDLDRRCDTLVTVHVGEDGVGSFHLQRVCARRQLCAARQHGAGKGDVIGLGARDG